MNPVKKSQKLLGVILFAIFSGIAFSACSCGNTSETPKKTAPILADSGKMTETSRPRTETLLSRHDVDAVFTGTQRHVCPGMTGLCPDRCGSSGTLALFRIEKYNNYENPGEYGDPRTDEFAFMLLSTIGTSAVSAEIAEIVRTLSPGDKVHLVWEHVRITDEYGSQFSERPVRELSPR